MNTLILLADDHKIMREGLRALIEEQSDMDVIGEAEDGDSAVQMARKLKPDVVVMDIGMPGLNGVDAARQIVNECPRTKVLGLSMHSDRHYVRELLEVGGSGYVLKGSAFEELVTAIRTVLDQRRFISPVLGPLKTTRQPAGENATPFTLLTPREREVLQKLAEGRTTKEIAQDLCLSPKTVETHRSHVMAKLELRSLAELTKYAVREGLTSLEE